MENVMSKRTLALTANQMTADRHPMTADPHPKSVRSKTTEAEYMLGHSLHEIRRLMRQAAILRPITERLLQSAGIGSGMRVLDLGCGAGDVSMLAAELVGPSGSVVGIDRSPQVIAVARERARAARLGHVEFKEAAADAFSDAEGFDCAIGRYVLVYQSDPAGLIRAAARLVRPGGVVAFHEFLIERSLPSLPPVRLFDLTMELLLIALQDGLPHHDTGGRLIEHFATAGLSFPAVFCEIPIASGEDSPMYAWLADSLQTVLPRLVQMGVVVTEEAVAVETLERRLRTAVVEARGQMNFPAQVCAWSRL
jgi:ubiquinone/menaquinone biosynthesis C-methylase UbiE